MKAVVNGASGYIGYHLVNSLLKNDHEVYALCRNGFGHLENIQACDNLHIIVTEQSAAKEKLSGVSPDVWYQLAWEGACGEKRSDPEIQIKNELLSVEAMKTAQLSGCGKFICTGTVYENVTGVILDNSIFDRNSFYIIAKKHAHEMTYQLSKKLDIDYIWCTFCHPIGRYMSENQLLPYAVKCFTEKRPAEFGSCSQYFDIIPVEYLTDSLVVLGENKCRGTNYYIGSGKPRILKEYIEEAAKICGYEYEIGFGKRKDDGMKFFREWFDSSDFLNEFSKKSVFSFEESIRELAENYKRG